MKTEKGFREEYSFLSNFTYFDKPMVRLEHPYKLTFLTNEHFYIAMKTTDVDIRSQVCKHPLKGLKKFGTSFTLREDWEDIKLKVMEYGIKYKFSHNNPTLRQKLINTGTILSGVFVLKLKQERIILVKY